HGSVPLMQHLDPAPRACHSRDARTDGSSSNPKSIKARRRSTLRRCTTPPSRLLHPNPPFGACVCSRTYVHARWIRRSRGSAPIWSRNITDHAVPVYFDQMGADRKSTRLNSSHVAISYAVFCLKKKIGDH